MKKIYQNPEITVVKIQPTQMIAASFEKVLGETETAGSNALGKSGWDMWADDEPEEADY